MSRGPLSFKQRDVTRAIKAAQSAGVWPLQVEIENNGKIVIKALSDSDLDDDTEKRNEWDEVR